MNGNTRAAKDKAWQLNIANCFLAFVAVAGIVAALTVALKSGLPQMVPASLALVLLLLSKNNARGNQGA